MRTRYPLLAAALVAAGFVAAAPGSALADCSDSHMSVAKADEPAKVTEPAATVTTPDAGRLQARAVEPSADRPAGTEAKPEVR